MEMVVHTYLVQSLLYYIILYYIILYHIILYYITYIIYSLCRHCFYYFGRGEEGSVHKQQSERYAAGCRRICLLVDSCPYQFVNKAGYVIHLEFSVKINCDLSMSHYHKL
jgi:hypothetical protein